LNIIEDPAKSVYYLLLGIGCLIYFLSPYDLVPDYIRILGYFDDLIFISAFIFSITHTFYSEFNDKNQIEFKLMRSN
jgi:uncharacterized membrane protein YkvA (DUF1232 family)